MLQTLLAEGRPLLADGATGTNLFAMGLTSGDSPELWNAVHPDRTQALHRAFVDAGSDIILTNSFGANRRRLMLHGLEARTRELNRLAAQNARKVADSAGRPVVVAGSVGPTGDLIAPLGPLSEDEAVEVFIEQIEGLPEEEKVRVLSEQAAAVMSEMPPRENTRVNTSLDSVHASGPLARAHCVIHGNCNYKQTGLLQAYAAYSLLQQAPLRAGFASGCQAFGHRELLAVLRSFGLVMEPSLTVQH